MAGLEQYDALRGQTWDRRFFACGTAHVFSRRADRLRRRLNLLSFAGLVLPFSVGAVVLAYSANLPGLTVILAVASGLGVVQAVASLWAVIQSWATRQQQAIQSALANQMLVQDFDRLARNPPSDYEQFRTEFLVLVARDDAQQQSDHAQGLSEAEMRRGMRFALREMQRSCTACGQVPTSMKPTDCGVCGAF